MNLILNRAVSNLVNASIELDLSDADSIIAFTRKGFLDSITLPAEVRDTAAYFRKVAASIDEAAAHGVENVTDIMIKPLSVMLNGYLNNVNEDESSKIKEATELLAKAYELEEQLDSLDSEVGDSTSEKISAVIRSQARPRLKQVQGDPILSVQLLLREYRSWVSNMLPARDYDSVVNSLTHLGAINIKFASAQTIWNTIVGATKALASRIVSAATKAMAIMDDVANFIHESKFPYSIARRMELRDIALLTATGSFVTVRNAFVLPYLRLSVRGMDFGTDLWANWMREQGFITFHELSRGGQSFILCSVSESFKSEFHRRVALANERGKFTDMDRLLTFLSGLPLQRHFAGFTMEEELIISSVGVANTAANATIAAASASGIFGRFFAAAAAAATTLAANSAEMIKFNNSFVSLTDTSRYLQGYRALYMSRLWRIRFEVSYIPYSLYLFFPWSDFKLVGKVAKLAAGVLTGVALTAAFSLAAGLSVRSVRNIIRTKQANSAALRSRKASKNGVKGDARSINGSEIRWQTDGDIHTYVTGSDGKPLLTKAGRTIPLDRREIKRKIAYSSFISSGSFKRVAGAGTGLGLGALTSALVSSAKSKKEQQQLKARNETIDSLSSRLDTIEKSVDSVLDIIGR